MLDGDFTRAELTAAVRAAACMSELLDALGIAATAHSRRRMFQRLSRAGIDRSHWVHSPHGGYTRDELAQAVAASTSFAGVLRFLGRPQAGGTQAHVARRVRREGLDTSHFTGRGHNRGKPQRRLTAQEVLVVLPPGSNRRKTPQLRRAMRESGVPDVCDACGLGPVWCGQPLTLVIEHRSGDWLDNRLGNLRLLCPNCHSQTATWCRRKTRGS